MTTAITLAADRLDDVIEVFADAFDDYPVMRFVVGSEGDVGARMRRLTALFVTRRVRRGGPILGVLDAGRLVGAAILTLPVEPEPPSDIGAIAEEAWRQLGEPARERYQAYAVASAAMLSGLGPHHHLNMIGIRRSHAGQGLARPLLDAVAEMAWLDPGSEGVSLTTERAQNVTLYEHFGYTVIAHREVASGLETWGLMRCRPLT